MQLRRFAMYLRPSGHTQSDRLPLDRPLRGFGRLTPAETDQGGQCQNPCRSSGSGFQRGLQPEVAVGLR